MDSAQQPGIGRPQGLNELANLNPNNLDWSQSEDVEHPVLVLTSQFLDTLVALPELEALEPDDSDSEDLDAVIKTSPEQLIKFMRLYSRYISYLRAFVTLITDSSGFLSLIQQLYKIRTGGNSLPQKRKLAQAGLDEHEPGISESASSCVEVHRRIQLLYVDLHHIFRIMLFEYQLLCDTEFPAKRDNERSQPTSPSPYLPLIVDHEKHEIRVLVLMPGQAEDKIDCRLVKIDLKTDNHFQALSYVWGSGDRSETIQVNETPFRVTPTLENILRGLRHPVDCRKLWIDAICINQDDNFEKITQVDLMGSIYQAAEAVAVWLSGDRMDGMDPSITRCQDTVGCHEHDLASLSGKMELILAQNDLSNEL
ncbi:hypothetical protein NUW58_g3773 [Xylaria curta]|uniref:Uncharacterized protein n=1 Tax=Xylaria curta TaxID=42375 RepID=A0ACC1P9E0_9PEZI|nr:hypothetical protein NUW58_g3773 [Xylaria curta]